VHSGDPSLYGAIAEQIRRLRAEGIDYEIIPGVPAYAAVGVRNMREIVRALAPHYGEDCPVVVAYRVGWPDQLLIRGTLADIRAKVRAQKITRTALILVGPALGDVRDFSDSALYDPAKPHVLRPVAGVDLVEENNT